MGLIKEADLISVSYVRFNKFIISDTHGFCPENLQDRDRMVVEFITTYANIAYYQ